MSKNLFKRIRNLSANDKIVFKNIIGAFIVKGGALFVTFFTLPAYIAFFNNDEVLGLWYTILSLLNWILNFDLGIGNGLRNYLSETLSTDDKEATKRFVSSAYFSIGAIVLVGIIILPIIVRFLDLNTLFNIKESVVSANSLYVAFVIVLVGVLLQFFLKLINAILYAMQKSSINNFLVLCTNVIILLFTLLYPSGNNDKNFIIMAVVHALAVAVPLLTATIFVFCGKLRFAFPRLKYVVLSNVKQVLSLGGKFFLVQIEYMIIMSTNEFLITKISGNSFVVEYQTYYKLFSLGSTVFALALTPLWSIITKAKVENNYSWIKKKYNFFILIALLFCIGEFLIIPLMRPIINIWLGENALSNISILSGVLFALLGCSMIVNSVMSSVANGLGALNTQAICFGIGACLKIPLAYWLVQVLQSWDGVVLANVICVAIYCIIQPIVLNKIFKKNEKLLKEADHE